MANHNQKLLRWALELQRFNLEVRHRPGSRNWIPDILSRLQSSTKHYYLNEHVLSIFAYQCCLYFCRLCNDNLINAMWLYITKSRSKNLLSLPRKFSLKGEGQLRCCICDFVFVSFVHSCIACVAGLLSDLAVCQTKTRDYCLIVAAACLRAALHSTCVCRPVNYTYGQHWEHMRKPSQPTSGPEDRGLRNGSEFSTARANVQRRRVIPRARLHVNPSRWQVALRSSVHRVVDSRRCRPRVVVTSQRVGQLKSVRHDRHVRYRVEGRTKRWTSGPDTEPRRFRQVDGNHIVASLAVACFRCRYCSAAGIR